MSLDACRVALVVFAMPGCPACHEFLPRLQRQVAGFQKLGHKFVYYEQGKTVVRNGEIPVVIVDSTSTDPSVIALADQHQISALPTTVILPRFYQPARYVGSLSDKATYEMLNNCVAANY